MTEKKIILVPEEVIMSKIYQIRGQKVMLDMDLAALYGVETKYLKQAVRRNIERFPKDFMFELEKKELKNLRSQIATSSWGGIRYVPMAFTEQGVAMLSSILKSKVAIKINISIIRVFTKMRELLNTHKEILKKLMEPQIKGIEQDEQIQKIFEVLRKLEHAEQKEYDFKNRRRIGFKRHD